GRQLGVRPQHPRAVVTRLLGEFGFIDGEVSLALDLQITPVALVAHQRLVPPGQLLAQRGHDRLPPRPVRLHLFGVDAHHVTPARDAAALDLQRRRLVRSLAGAMHHAEAAARGQHLVADLSLTQAGAEDVRPALLLQVGERLLADHAAVGDDADLTEAETPPQAIHDGDQGGHVAGVARPQFAAD